MQAEQARLSTKRCHEQSEQAQGKTDEGAAIDKADTTNEQSVQAQDETQTEEVREQAQGETQTEEVWEQAQAGQLVDMAEDLDVWYWVRGVDGWHLRSMPVPGDVVNELLDRAQEETTGPSVSCHPPSSKRKRVRKRPSSSGNATPGNPKSKPSESETNADDRNDSQREPSQAGHSEASGT